jgi:hypothetical protein
VRHLLQRRKHQTGATRTVSVGVQEPQCGALPSLAQWVQVQCQQGGLKLGQGSLQRGHSVEVVATAAAAAAVEPATSGSSAPCIPLDVTNSAPHVLLLQVAAQAWCLDTASRDNPPNSTTILNVSPGCRQGLAQTLNPDTMWSALLADGERPTRLGHTQALRRALLLH